MGQGRDGMNESWEPEDIEEPKQRRVNHLLPEPERLRIEADGLFKRAKKAEEKNKALTAERDQLRAEVDRLRGLAATNAADATKAMQMYRAATALAEAAEAHVADLRGALEEIVGACTPVAWEYPQADGETQAPNFTAYSESTAALARTPAQSLARVKAEALREAAGIIESTPPYEWAGTHREGWDHAALHLRHLAAEAARLEKEAAHDPR